MKAIPGAMQTFFKLRLPSSLPYVFSALKVGATAAMIGSVVAEFFNSAGGIGKLIANNIQSGDFALAWCGVVIVTVVGWSSTWRSACSSGWRCRGKSAAALRFGTHQL